MDNLGEVFGDLGEGRLFILIGLKGIISHLIDLIS